MTAAVTTVVRPRQPDADERALQSWELVTRAQAGDPDAVAELYRRCHPRLLAMMRRRLPDLGTAEELAHEVWVRALRRIGGLQWQGRDVLAWLSTIARNLVADYYKSPRVNREQLAGDPYVSQVFETASPEDPLAAVPASLDAALDAAVLRRLVMRLSPDQQQVLIGRYWRDLPLTEVAAEMGRDYQAVKAIAYRAHRRLERIVREQGMFEQGMFQ
ncbi:RNA polymerase sigma factor [Mangrovihabitans endophyticus]|uniref:RNA polymerase sigma factor n=1 Tax=Mangrovihabitans endophyticus TaxID=1751298 RepID=A0A8J3BXL2_9ACTN|nr:RNA polymerase sigma factor [Mangrovihabitans endophyticus]GGK89486.1 RNA polymerase sigma factor [Mangrovihabitans endophyticus]